MALKEQEGLVKYRLQRADQALSAARLLIENGFFNDAASKLYYSSYYLVTAILAHHNIQAHTHTGVKSQFNLHFMRPGLMDREWGELHAELYDKRQEGDYTDYLMYAAEDIQPYLSKVQAFSTIVKQFLNNLDK